MGVLTVSGFSSPGGSWLLTSSCHQPLLVPGVSSPLDQAGGGTEQAWSRSRREEVGGCGRRLLGCLEALGDLRRPEVLCLPPVS